MTLTEREHELDFEYELNEHDTEVVRNALKWAYELGKKDHAEKHRKPLLDAHAKVMKEISTRVPEADRKPVADALGELLEAISDCVYGGTNESERH